MLEVVVVCKKVACGGGMGFVEQYARRLHAAVEWDLWNSMQEGCMLAVEWDLCT